MNEHEYPSPFQALLIVVGIFFNIFLMLFLLLSIKKELQPLCVTVYTCEDIYYLRGNTVSSESGRIPTVVLSTPNEAIRFLEEQTIDDTNSSCDYVHEDR